MKYSEPYTPLPSLKISELVIPIIIITNEELKVIIKELEI